MTPTQILTVVVSVTGVSVSELHNHYREPRVVRARRLAVYLLRTHTDLSYPDIAAVMGRDRCAHNSQIYRYRDARRLLSEDKEFKGLVSACEGRLS